jgi:hypothetical protein
MELTLYQISEEQRRIEALLEESAGELTPEIEAALAVNESNFMEKSRDYGFAILRYKAFIEAIKQEKSRLDGLKKSAENAIERMEERLVGAMQQFDKTKVEMDTIKLSLRRSERVVVDDEAKVPADCIKVTTTVNKTDLKAHIKSGEECGAHLEENQSLQIK